MLAPQAKPRKPLEKQPLVLLEEPYLVELACQAAVSWRLSSND
jgi:hypothetical protein